MECNVKVSICCITFNHEKYIQDTLESFVKQSCFSMVKGKYIALCEGDDYWIDPQKLEKQMAFLDNHLNYVMCFHASKVYDCKQERYEVNRRFHWKSETVTVNRVIENGGIGIPTASLVFRRKGVQNLPQFYYNCPVGDYPMQLILATRGRVCYMNQIMSFYRRNSDSSISNILLSNNNNALNVQVIKMLKSFSKYTDGVYSKAINKRIFVYRYCELYANKERDKLMKPPYIYHYIKILFLKYRNRILRTLEQGIDTCKNAFGRH